MDFLKRFHGFYFNNYFAFNYNIKPKTDFHLHTSIHHWQRHLSRYLHPYLPQLISERCFVH